MRRRIAGVAGRWPTPAGVGRAALAGSKAVPGWPAALRPVHDRVAAAQEGSALGGQHLEEARGCPADAETARRGPKKRSGR